MTLIQNALANLFQKHRIVFWFDSVQKLKSEFDVIEIDGVEKIEIHDNDFGLKHLLIKEAPNQKFLLYREGSQPSDLENWLLDVQLANGVFRADQVSLWMAEIGLPIDQMDVVRDNEGFFRDDSRRNELKKILVGDESPDDLCMKMLAVSVSALSDPKLENILLVLMDELAEGGNTRNEVLKECGLEQYLWEKVKKQYGYISGSPSPLDFSIDLFKSCYAISLSEKAEMNKDTLIFLKSWKDSHTYRKSFGILSNKVAELIDIEGDIRQRDIQNLMEIDYFRLIDQKIINDLIGQITNNTIPQSDCEKIIWQRRRSFWFGEFSNVYNALQHGSSFLSSLEKADFTVQSIPDGIQKYKSSWHQLDFLYRKFIYHAKVSNQATLLNPLINKIDQYYSNNFLLKANDQFQQAINQLSNWDASQIGLQRGFFESYVKPYFEEHTKVAVVISDGLRYEIGAELMDVINREDRFTAEIEIMLSMLPSYTQLGMAALLPNKKLLIMQDGSVQVDGMSTQGLDNRNKLLQNALGKDSLAIRSSDLMGMSQNESRELVKGNQVIYIFHNLIDATGDKGESEDKVFLATENAMSELVDVVKKLYNANISNVIITSDHGFIYQDHLVDESEFVGEDIQGDKIYYRTRRFAIGKNLKENQSVKTFSSSELGLGGESQIQIPKSINRLRLKGAGIRYVHGGASLQEIVLPVIQVSKKRSTDIEKVQIDIIASQSNVITTGQVTVTLYQKEPISPKIQPREVLVGIYANDNTLISDEHKINFDLTSDNARDREVKVQFILSQKASDFNNQIVNLKLSELIPNTTKYKDHKSVSFQLKRSIGSDFEF